MTKKLKAALAFALVGVMCLGFAVGCQQTTPPTEVPDGTEATETAQPAVEEASPLVVAYSPFSEKFSPFFADTGYDVDAMEMTQLIMLTTDRMGGIIYNAIEGETVSYNGTDYLYQGPCDVSVSHDAATDITTYTIKMRDDIVFSDGEIIMQRLIQFNDCRMSLQLAG